MLGLLVVGCVKSDQASQESGAARSGHEVWRGSFRNGDKPGTGVEFVRIRGKFEGTLYIIDPNSPDDFSRARKVPMVLIAQEPGTLVFRVALGDREDQIRFEFPAPLTSSPMSVRMIREGGVPRDITLARVTP